MVRQTGPKAISKRQRLKHLKRSQARIGRKTIEVRKAVSQRARTHPMEAAGIGQPQTPQALLLDSTAIRKFKYWIDENRLRIWFVEGGVYDYYNVPESVVITLSQAQSKGRYFYYNIRLEYDFRRVDGGIEMAKKRKVKPLPKMTPKRRAKINKSYAKYNRRYFPASTPKKRRKR